MTTEDRRRRKPTTRWVNQLQRELGQVRDDLDFCEGELERVKAELAQKSDDLTLALNKRDDAREDRDLARKDATEIFDLRQANCEELIQVRSDIAELADRNRENFDKAYRNAEVAAVLAKVIIAETDEGPIATMKRFITSAGQMGISPEILDEVKNALARGFLAQMELASIVAVDELSTEAIALTPSDGAGSAASDFANDYAGDYWNLIRD